MPRLRETDRRARRQGRRVRVLQALSSGRDRAAADARVGTGCDARVAAAIWQAAIVDRLVSHARPTARRRAAEAPAERAVAVAVDCHRPLRDLGRGRGGRLYRQLTDSVWRAISRRARYLPTEVPHRLSQRNHAVDRNTAAVTKEPARSEAGRAAGRLITTLSRGMVGPRRDRRTRARPRQRVEDEWTR